LPTPYLHKAASNVAVPVTDIVGMARRMFGTTPLAGVAINRSGEGVDNHKGKTLGDQLGAKRGSFRNLPRGAVADRTGCMFGKFWCI
jgi:hypothetical protein